jgi:hypothetical protein
MTQSQTLHELALQLLQTDPAGFDRLVEQHIMLTDLPGMVQKTRDAAARSLNYFFKDLQVESPPYSRDVSAAMSALSHMQQARPSTRLEVVVQQDGCRAQVSFWREIDRGTIIYGSAQHKDLAAAISLAMLSAESKTIQMSCSMRDLREPKPPAIKAVEDLLRHLRGMALADLPGQMLVEKIREVQRHAEDLQAAYQKVEPLLEKIRQEPAQEQPVAAAPAPSPAPQDVPPDFDAIDQVIQQAEQAAPETKES